APVLWRVNQPGHRSRNANGSIANQARVGYYIALRVQVHVTTGGFRSFLAKVEKMYFAIGFAQQHESAAADVPCRRMDHCQRKSCGHGSVHGVAALPRDVRANSGGFLVDADHHRLPRMDRPKSFCMAWLGNRHTEDNYLKN